MNYQSEKAISLELNHLNNSEKNQHTVGDFEIFDLSRINVDNIFFSFNYSRKTFYTATLLLGDYILEFEDRKVNLTGSNLIFTNNKIPFGIQAVNRTNCGLSCVFKEEFITKNNSGYRLLELPIYKPGRQNIYSITDTQTEKFIDIYNRIFDERLNGGEYQESLQRTYLLELIFHAQKLDPTDSYIKVNNTTEEITCSFIRLLESQFPIDTQEDIIKLKTAGDFAEHLSLHPNYLNRQVKLSKGRTVSEIIAARIGQEAKILLKVTNWNIAQIAYSLGFEEPSHFNSFFKKQNKVSPTDYRKLKKD
ncbi:helix-turn-helix domain-containing protein [Chryseobacterium sp. FH1]|uniref:helix-turn-helix domain-containing protein n=1 Tax=Chryseobacterium sp. FH1 TaxID=1233951 RepID=UPI00068F9BC9|nr:AraC family transcriptional regulator [Chryseobacterium sp. FH1]